MFSSGGIIKPGWWDSVPKYAKGTPRAGNHGSLFVAGEAGAELVGHMNGTTEVLNRFQLAQVMHSSIVAGMSQFTGYWRNMNSQIIKKGLKTIDDVPAQLREEVKKLLEEQ